MLGQTLIEHCETPEMATQSHGMYGLKSLRADEVLTLTRQCSLPCAQDLQTVMSRRARRDFTTQTTASKLPEDRCV